MSVEQFIASQRNDHTKRAYRTDLAHWTKFVGSEDISLDTVTRFRDHIEQTYKSTTAVRIFNTVRTYHKWVGQHVDLFDKVKAPKRIANWVPVVPDEDEVNSMLGVVNNARDRAIISLLLNGLRAQEVCDLNVDDFYFDKGLNAHMLRVTGKGGKLRVIPASDECAIAVNNVMVRRGRLFRNLNPRKVHYIVEKYGKMVGADDIHPHALRHNYATRLVRNNVDVFSVQRLLGHSRAETTQVYVNLDLQDLVNAARKDPRNVQQANRPSGQRGEAPDASRGKPVRRLSAVAG